MCDGPLTLSHAHVHKLNVVWAGRSRRLTVGTATSAILANICRTTRGHSERALNPHTVMLWGETFFPFSECRQTGTSGAAANLQAAGLLEGRGIFVGFVAPPIVQRPIIAVQRRVTASIGSELPSLVQLDGFGF
ncbi:hypothetical protein PBY51_015369 [Eleginops maclovinus]|uniref:Uncharacterized protein n=1 Tax=Eleginops maclovinus TaxID=56733 RepID=A0AAN7X2H8_ELEMC|nr:hypothetical protein PBY51_015369 [Eleginops maclovinus]